MSVAEQFTLILGLALMVGGVTGWAHVRGRIHDEQVRAWTEGTHYAKARAAEVALATPVVTPHHRHDPSRFHSFVTADEMREVLVVDEWERHLEDGAA